MNSFLPLNIKGYRLAAVTLASIIYGWLILGVLSQWQNMERAEGGTEIQARLFSTATDVAQAVNRLAAAARSDVYGFYLLDVVNAALFALSLAGLTGFALRHLGWNRTLARWLVMPPIISGLSDMIENAALATALARAPEISLAFAGGISVLTSFKLITGYASIAIMLGTVFAALIGWSWKKFRTRK